MDLEYFDGDLRCLGVLELPDEGQFPGARPGIVIAHEAWGLTDHVRRRARMLADLGFVALAADTYGQRHLPSGPPEAMRLIGELGSSPDILRPRMQAAVAALVAHPRCNGQIAAIGYCFGGQCVLELARSGDPNVLGVISFHGTLKTARAAEQGQIRARILVCHGAEDAVVPPAELLGFLEEMATAGADCQTICYTGARHGFTNVANDGSVNPSVIYDAATDHRSWQAMQAHLAEIFA